LWDKVYLQTFTFGELRMITAAAPSVNGLSSFSSVWAIIEAAKSGAADATTAARGFLPAVAKAVCAGTHASGFVIGYAVVFPAYLVARTIPHNNPIVFGLADGGRAGLDLAKNTLQPSPQSLISIAATPA
jgi:hypothetical protein